MQPMDPRQQAMSRMGAMGVPPGDGDGFRSDEGKQPMGSVHYGPATDPNSACMACKSFVGPDACELVAGKIDPHGTCDLFEPGAPGAPDMTTPPTEVPTAPISA